jgi:acetyl esterase/lipase
MKHCHNLHTRRIGQVLSLFGFVVLSGGGSPLEAERSRSTYDVEILRDISYYDGENADSVRHKLDLYLPKGAKDFPAVLFFHGGGWSRGDKLYWGMAPGFCTLCAKHGIGAASANYRLSPSVQHPGHVQDAALAFAWLYKNIGKYNGNAKHLFVCGHSAGGHLAALLSTDPTRSTSW